MRAVAKITAVATLAVTFLTSSGALAQGPERREDAPLRPNRYLLLSGAVVFAASYIPAFLVPMTSGRDGDQFLAIPIAGPWFDLTERGGCGPNPCGEEAGYKTLIVASGIGQLVGTGLVIASFMVPDRGEGRVRAATSTKPTVTPAQLGRSGAGLAIVGRF